MVYIELHSNKVNEESQRCKITINWIDGKSLDRCK
jgi:hypothetical protein